MTQRLAFLAIAALFLLGTTSCGKKDEKPADDDLQMKNPAVEQTEGSVQAV